MTNTLKCISPIDGSVYLERPVLSLEAARDVCARAKAAQGAWAARPLAERVQLVRDAIAEVGKTTDRMAQELEHQMGRPVR